MDLNKLCFLLTTIFTFGGCVSPYEFFSGKNPPSLTLEQIRAEHPIALHVVNDISCLRASHLKNYKEDFDKKIKKVLRIYLDGACL